MNDHTKTIVPEGGYQRDVGLALCLLKDLGARPDKLLQQLGNRDFETRPPKEGEDYGAVSFSYEPGKCLNKSVKAEIVALPEGLRCIRWYNELGELVDECEPCESPEIEEQWWVHTGVEPHPCPWFIHGCIFRAGKLEPDADVMDALSDWEIYYAAKLHLTGRWDEAHREANSKAIERGVGGEVVSIQRIRGIDRDILVRTDSHRKHTTLSFIND